MYLGIDIGGSNIKIVSLSSEWKLLSGSLVIKTPKRKKFILRALANAIRAQSAQKSISGIGVGVPGVVDPRRGVLINAPNMPFLNGWDAKNFFKKFRAPVRVDNDSRCFLRAEAALGVGRGHKHIAVLTIGTGIGGGLLIDGKMYYGSRAGAGEFGHMIVNHGKTLEELAGKKAFEARGDRSDIIGIGVANIINAFDPEVIILGGGGIFGKTLKLAKIRAIARKYTVSPLGKRTRVLRGTLGECAGAIGAALLFKKGVSMRATSKM